METIADGLIWATDAVDVTINNAAALDVYTTVFTVDSASMTAYTDVTSANGAVADVAITLPAETIAGTYKYIVTFEFTVNTGASATGAFVDVYSSVIAGEVPNTESFYSDASDFRVPVSLSFGVSASAVPATFTLRAKCATNTWTIQGPVRMHAVRVRQS
jgi:hypothetical protein